MATVRFGAGAKTLLTLAAFILVIAGLKAAAGILLPFLIAVFLSVLAAPMVLWLERRGVMDWLAVTLALVAVLGVLVAFGVMLTSALSGFEHSLPGYRVAFELIAQSMVERLERMGVESSSTDLSESLGPGSIMTMASSLVGSVIMTLSNAVLVAFTMMFILLEIAGFPRKVRAALEDPDADLSGYDTMLHEVQRYLFIKTVVSLATGAAATLFLLLLGLDFPLLWGLLAFLLNYIPTFGSLLAAIPPILIALVQPGMGPLHALVVTAGYLFINTVLGYIIEPQWMGRQLGLSPLVVLMSLVFWGWVWGPVGMLLSVPLTMMVKIMLENSDDLRWIAVFLGPTPKAEDVAAQSMVGRIRLRRGVAPEDILRTGALDKVEVLRVGDPVDTESMTPGDLATSGDLGGAEARRTSSTGGPSAGDEVDDIDAALSAEPQPPSEPLSKKGHATAP